MANLYYEALMLEDDEAYEDIYTDLGVKTDGWILPEGEVRYADKTDADVAVSILKERYANVKLEPLDYENGDDLSYHITFSDDPVEDFNESLSEKDNDRLYNLQQEISYLTNKYNPLTDEEREKLHRLQKRQAEIHKKADEDFDPQGLNWIEDKTPTGTPLGNGTGIAEDFEPEEEVDCPLCGGVASYIEGQGNFSFYKCLDCGEYLFQNQKGEVKTADDAFDSEGNLLKEANGDDSFRDAQDYYDSLTTPEQQEVIDKLTNDLTNIGFDSVEVEQLIPTRDSESNVFVNCCIQHPDKPIEEYEQSVQDILEKSGAEDIRLTADELNMPKCKYKVWGYCNIPNMTLENVDND